MEDIKDTLFEVLNSILPITIIITILQFTVIFLPTEVFVQFLIGVILVSVGLFLFLLGVGIGLAPVGEMIGSSLSKMGRINLILMFGFMLGFAVTMAEPGVRVLSNQIDYVSGGDIPSSVLILAVSIGVGIFVALSIARIIFNIALLKLLAIGYTIIFILAIFTSSSFLPISLDAGGATTGPMAVPFILALGLGISSVLRGKATSGDGFGLIALASIGPVIAVLLLGVIYG